MWQFVICVEHDDAYWWLMEFWYWLEWEQEGEQHPWDIFLAAIAMDNILHTLKTDSFLDANLVVTGGTTVHMLSS